MKDLVELYCHIDDYCQANDTQIKTPLIEYKQSKKTRNRSSSISVSGIITIHHYKATIDLSNLLKESLYFS